MYAVMIPIGGDAPILVEADTMAELSEAVRSQLYTLLSSRISFHLYVFRGHQYKLTNGPNIRLVAPNGNYLDFINLLDNSDEVADTGFIDVDAFAPLLQGANPQSQDSDDDDDDDADVAATPTAQAETQTQEAVDDFLDEEEGDED